MIGQFLRVIAEAAKIMHTDREFVYNVLGKYLRITERPILDAAYNAEIKALEQRLVIRNEALQAILDEIAPTDARAKNVKPHELIDARYVTKVMTNVPKANYTTLAAAMHQQTTSPPSAVLGSEMAASVSGMSRRTYLAFEVVIRDLHQDLLIDELASALVL